MTNEIVKKYTEIDEMVFMTVDEAIALSHELADRAMQTDIQFDEVVGIANGARLMTTVIAEHMGIPYQMLTIRRKGSVVKEYLGKFPLLVRFFSAWYSIPILKYPLIRVMCMMRGFSDSNDQTSQMTEVDTSREIKNVLIVDDALEFGSTIQAAKTIMKNKNESCEAVVAVMSWRILRPNETQVESPEIFISRIVQHYPWSMNSPHYDEYQHWLKDHNA